MMNKNNRFETLKANGVDTSKYFTLMVNKDIPAGTKVNVSLDVPGENNETNKYVNPIGHTYTHSNDNVYAKTFNNYNIAYRNKEPVNEIEEQIIEDGYVRNTKLHRRFVAAQYMRMLESYCGWYKYLNRYYSYMYQIDMMINEVRVLAELEKRDREAFNERSRFFTRNVITDVLEQYIKDVKSYIKTLKVKSCKGRPYVYIKKFGFVFCDEIDNRIIDKLNMFKYMCTGYLSYKSLYQNLIVFRKVAIELPYEYKKCRVWVDAFQKEGAFYTLKNLIMFHDVKLYYNHNFVFDTKEAMVIINELVNPHYRKCYMGYQMHALLKKTIEMNNFNFRKSIEEHK